MSLNLKDFLFDTPLYTKVKVSPDDHIFSKGLVYKPRIEEAYNPLKRKETSFILVESLTMANDTIKSSGGYSVLKIRCSRFYDIFVYPCYWDHIDKNLMKIGQYPSLADAQLYKLKDYKEILPDNKKKEFTRAIGLAANGIGIGSFVYLRRIFEFLVADAFETHKQEIDKSQFHSARMDERIQLLSNYLPSFLVDNAIMYSILSKGIHELDEDTCLKHFDVLKMGIELILNEKLEQRKKEKTTKKFQKAIQDLKGKINNKK